MVSDDPQFWIMRHADHVVHQDTAEHVALVLRVLGISEKTWRCMIKRYATTWTLNCRDLDVRAELLGWAYSACAAMNTKPNSTELVSCPICRSGIIFPAFARKVGVGSSDLQYGCCNFCGHGLLLSQPADAPIYKGLSYFSERRPDGVGYEGYEKEKIYREEKARRLFDWIYRATGVCSGRLLEVGSSLGFSRKAAQDRGFVTTGIDLNPYAAERALALYGMDTFTGTLTEARQSGAVRHDYDLVLYQFVLEHLTNPAAELREIASILGPGCRLVLTIPSMDALELKVFGGSYRSFRSDHCHIFSCQSIGLLLRDAGFTVTDTKTDCSAHLLQGFYSGAELQTIYDSGRGPDMFVIAQREAHEFSSYTHSTPH
jgi:2-polyprenyl-3-methyl-5-hydroxy-6-metoxy-1,4-benzoquinol methylase